MKTVTKWLTAATSVAAVLLVFACKKNNSSNTNSSIPAGQSQLSLYMMDGPVQFTKVLIDIRQVAVEIDTATAQNSDDRDDQWDDNYNGWHHDGSHKSVIWDTLSIKPGVYDLLQLRNGTDTLLASGQFPSGKILKLKITLGSDNTIFTDSTTSYPLEVFGPNPYFTVNVSRVNVASVSSNDFKVWLDFNLSRSVVFWNGQFLLKPYLIVFNDQVTAKVQGQVLPSGAAALVTAYNATDTLYAVPFWNGQYQFRGVPAGTWSVNFKGRGGYQDTTLANIKVDSMKVVKLPTITLHK
jgi:hypothetical protein